MPDKGNLPFKIPDEKVASYLELKANNSDGYGTLIMNAAELWGANMEKEISFAKNLNIRTCYIKESQVKQTLKKQGGTYNA